MLRTVQGLRALAVVMVVAYHAIVTQPTTVAAPPLAYMAHLGEAGVDIFFVISGFIMLHGSFDRFEQPGHPMAFLRKRAIRIAPTYYVMTTFVVALLLFAPSLYSNLRFDLSNAVFSYLFIMSKNSAGGVGTILGVGWTLCFEAFFYVCFAIALRFRRDRALMVLGGAFVLSLILTNTLAKGAIWATVPSSPIILEFLFGCAIAYAFRRQMRLPEKAAWALMTIGFLALVAAAASQTVATPLSGWRPVVYGLPAAAIVLGAVSLEHTRARVPQAAVRLGDSSYSVYLTHQFALQAVFIVLAAVGLGPQYGAWLVMMVCGVAVALVLGHVFYRTVETGLASVLRPRRPAIASARDLQPS